MLFAFEDLLIGGLLLESEGVSLLLLVFLQMETFFLDVDVTDFFKLDEFL